MLFLSLISTSMYMHAYGKYAYMSTCMLRRARHLDQKMCTSSYPWYILVSTSILQFRMDMLTWRVGGLSNWLF